MIVSLARSRRERPPARHERQDLHTRPRRRSPLVGTAARVLLCPALASTFALAACASAPPDAALDDGTVATVDSDRSSPPTATAPPVASVAPATSSPEPAGPRERELTARECEVLAQRYGDLTRSDAMAGLKPGLTEGQRQQAQQNILAAADKLSERWEKGCVESVVGKVANEDALKCAMSAKTVADFDVCLNGPPEEHGAPEKR
jgi:hypothetical protein